jgi:hypothetical protein
VSSSCSRSMMSAVNRSGLRASASELERERPGRVRRDGDRRRLSSTGADDLDLVALAHDRGGQITRRRTGVAGLLIALVREPQERPGPAGALGRSSSRLHPFGRRSLDRDATGCIRPEADVIVQVVGRLQLASVPSTHPPSLPSHLVERGFTRPSRASPGVASSTAVRGEQ